MYDGMTFVCSKGYFYIFINFVHCQNDKIIAVITVYTQMELPFIVKEGQ